MTLKGVKGSAACRGSKSSGSEESAWQNAIRWLVRRDRSVHETREYLLHRSYSAEVVARVIDRLCAAGYLDDQRLATNRAQYWLCRGYGRLRAEAELRGRGISEAIVAEVLEETFQNEAAVARDLFERRFAGAQIDEAARARGYRFLLSRGFPEATVVVIVGEPC